MLPLVYNDQPIPIREDGYLNATRMCQAGGKRWHNWWQLGTTQALITALETATGIPATELVQSVSGGDPQLQGTWVHKEVALGLAHWISAEFYATCIGVLTGRVQHTPVVQRPSLTQAQFNIEWLLSLADKLPFDERDMLTIKNYATTLALPPTGGEQTIYNEIALSSYLHEKFQIVLRNEKLSRIGRWMAARYREVFGKEPTKHAQQVEGAVRPVNGYPRSFLEEHIEECRKAIPDAFVSIGK
jgi:hypothetical protein